VIEIHEGEFARVRISAMLERSLHLALGGVHAPFFTIHEGDAVVVILRREEWDHLASRFVSVRPETGFRLVSICPPRPDRGFPARLSAALAAAGVTARLLPSFHNDKLLVAGMELDRALETIRRQLDEDCPSEAVP
jgi:hypothetical protein